MLEQPSYGELAEAIAAYLHVHNRSAEKTSSGEELVFFHGFISIFENCAHALQLLGILKEVRRGGPCYRFTCQPTRFLNKAKNKQTDAVTYNDLRILLQNLLFDFVGYDTRTGEAMLKQRPGSRLGFECLARLGICEMDRHGRCWWKDDCEPSMQMSDLSWQKSRKW